jgi:hypothetical protein
MEFIVHDNPVGRTDRNYIARADLGPFGLDGQMEQLWLRPLDDGTFAIACIPFRTYGLALGDRVRLSGEGTQVAEVLTASGHRVLRMLLITGAGPERLAEGIARIKTEMTTRSARLRRRSGRSDRRGAGRGGENDRFSTPAARVLPPLRLSDEPLPTSSDCDDDHTIEVTPR